MKIRKLELKNFGKFTDKTIELQDGIQLFYGENESGKTTLHTFIRGMLFGLPRGRGRASVNDIFKKYEPWDMAHYYAGVLIFESGNKTFRLERNFDTYSRKAVLYCENDGEELSVADGDLEMLLAGLHPAEYEDTLSIGQLHTKTSQALAAEFKNYAINYYAAGDSEIDLVRAQELLLSRIKEAEKGIKAAIQRKQDSRDRLEQESSYIWRDIHKMGEDIEDVKAEINYIEEKETAKKKKEQESKGVIDEIRPAKWRIHPLEIIALLIFVVAAFVLISKPWNYLVAIIIALLSGIYVWNRVKEGRHRVKIPEAGILEEMKAGEGEVSKEKLLWELKHLEEEQKEKQIQYENIQEQIEELDETGDDYKRLEQKKAAARLAGERLETLSAHMQRELGLELNKKASEIIENITGGKYTRLIIDENLQMSLMNGDKKAGMEQVSQGTLEQVYFALRMAVSALMHEEDYPVILDDTFVFYDEERLARTLKWLHVRGGQILLFTCQKREEEVMTGLGIPFTKTEL